MPPVPWFTALAGARLYVTVPTVSIRTRYETVRDIKSGYWTTFIKFNKLIGLT